MNTCPGQDQRYWKPEDIFDLDCPFCSQSIEFWKDDVTRICPACSRVVLNPRIDRGCLKWCKYADQCRQQFES